MKMSNAENAISHEVPIFVVRSLLITQKMQDLNPLRKKKKRLQNLPTKLLTQHKKSLRLP